jgi:putative transposase
LGACDGKDCKVEGDGGFVLGDREKDHLLGLIKRLSSFYFAEVLGFCVMGNHFHLLVRMHPESSYWDEDVRERYERRYGEEKTAALDDNQMRELSKKMAGLSEYVREVKQSFSRYYKRLHKKKGYFWSERLKSMIVENGETFINCLAYIDLNSVRAGLVKRPEDYRWCSLVTMFRQGIRDGFCLWISGFGSSELVVGKRGSDISGALCMKREAWRELKRSIAGSLS